VRHSAWLNTAPNKRDGDKSKKKELTRRAQFKEDGLHELEMPPCDCLHVVTYLFEVGPTMQSGMGESPITHQEIAAWQSNTGIELQTWEARFMRQLSIEYLSEAQRAAEHDCAAPWSDAPYIVAPHAIMARRMQSAVEGLAKL